jgi:hypothetical protein
MYYMPRKPNEYSCHCNHAVINVYAPLERQYDQIAVLLLHHVHTLVSLGFSRYQHDLHTTVCIHCSPVECQASVIQSVLP